MSFSCASSGCGQLRRERLWAEPLYWAARLVTLGRFGGEEELGRRMQREFEERRSEVLATGVGHRRDRVGDGGASSEN